jgi:hypothetical protein
MQADTNTGLQAVKHIITHLPLGNTDNDHEATVNSSTINQQPPTASPAPASPTTETQPTAAAAEALSATGEGRAG